MVEKKTTRKKNGTDDSELEEETPVVTDLCDCGGKYETKKLRYYQNDVLLGTFQASVCEKNSNHVAWTEDTRQQIEQIKSNRGSIGPVKLEPET